MPSRENPLTESINSIMLGEISQTKNSHVDPKTDDLTDMETRVESTGVEVLGKLYQ